MMDPGENAAGTWAMDTNSSSSQSSSGYDICLSPNANYTISCYAQVLGPNFTGISNSPDWAGFGYCFR